MLQSKPSHLKYDSLKSKIENGNVLIPQFQRNFVWKKADAANLLDSILKGYPIGSFILWETKSRLRAVKKIGNIDLPAAKPGESVYYVLDGQQRVTSIYVSICGLKVNKDDFSQLYALERIGCLNKKVCNEDYKNGVIPCTENFLLS